MDEMNRSRMRSNTIVANQQKAQLQRDYQAITQKEMNPLFLENQKEQKTHEFPVVGEAAEKEVEEDTIKINRLLDHAEDLRLTKAQKTDLEIRRNRNLNFGLVYDVSKSDDSKEMGAVRNDIRAYEKILFRIPKTGEERQQMIEEAKAHCQKMIDDCDAYLNRGWSFFFWRQGRNDHVAAAKERFQKDYDTFSKLLEASDMMKKTFHADDRLIDLMNVEAIDERMSQQIEEQRRVEKEMEDRRMGEERAEGVNELFAGAEEEYEREEQKRKEEQKRIEEDEKEKVYDEEEQKKEEKRCRYHERMEGYRQGWEVNKLFTGAEEEYEREEQKRKEKQKRMEEDEKEKVYDEEEQKKEEKRRRYHERMEGYRQGWEINKLFTGAEEEYEREEQKRREEGEKERVYDEEEEDEKDRVEEENEEEYEKEKIDEQEMKAERKEENEIQPDEDDGLIYEDARDHISDIQVEGDEVFYPVEDEEEIEEEKKEVKGKEVFYSADEDDEVVYVDEKDHMPQVDMNVEKKAEEKQEVEKKQDEKEEQQEQQNKQEEKQVEEQKEEQKEVFGSEELEKLRAVDTKEMREVRAAITEIQAKMAQQMPKVAVTENQAVDQKAERRARKQGVDEFCAEMIKSFNKLYRSIDECLKTKNGAGYKNSKASKDILTHLQEYTKRDRTLFKDKVVSYRAWLGENAEEANKEHTWSDAWKYVRSTTYNLDVVNNGFEIKTVGAGASYITRITDTKKKQTVYFRRNENVGDDSADEFVTHFMNAIKGDINCPNNVKEALERQFRAMITEDVFQDVEGMEAKLNKHRGYDGEDLANNWQDFIDENEDLCSAEFKKVFDQASLDVKAEMGKALQFFAKKCFQYNFSLNTAKIDLGESLTDRNVATSRLAAALGISSMVSDSRTAVIKKDGQEIMGNVMEESRGQEILTVEGDWTYSNKAISQSFTLQVFDILCGQIDRHGRNFHVITKEKDGKKVVNSIKAIDNDMAFGAIFPDEEMYNGYQNICPLTECHIRSMPINVINSILKMDEDVLPELLGDLIGSDTHMMRALKDRLKFIQGAIRALAGDGQSGLKIKGNGEAAFEGEDADDELRMLKAVKEFTTNGGNLRWYDGKNIEKRDKNDYDGTFNRNMKSLIEWTHLQDLDDKITKARAAWQNKHRKEQGNNQA